MPFIRPNDIGRLIPARAGKTTLPNYPAPYLTAHPRAGGENGSWEVLECKRSGSSPRGRGKHPKNCPREIHPRLIPARAGKTCKLIPNIEMSRAHPRAGGENAGPLWAFGLFPGSSPRGRGKHAYLPIFNCPVRLIPARAGKTCPASRRSALGLAHPRAGGENTLDGLVVDLATGSSPRGRGKLLLDEHLGEGARLIPARTGKTLPASRSARRARAHPRAGGENTAHEVKTAQKHGSSPRGRGKLE